MIIKDNVDLKEFVYWINNYQPDENDYCFYITIDNEQYEIVPIYNIFNEVHELDFKGSYENIFDEYDLTIILIAKYSIIERRF